MYIYCAELEWHKRAYLEETAKRLRSEFPVRVTPILLNNHEVAQAI